MLLRAPELTNNQQLPFGNCDKKFLYYRMFDIRIFVLFALRYSLFGIIYYSLCVIACSNYYE